MRGGNVGPWDCAACLHSLCASGIGVAVSSHSAGVSRYGEGVWRNNHRRKTHGLMGAHKYYSPYHHDGDIPPAPGVAERTPAPAHAHVHPPVLYKVRASGASANTRD